MAKTIFGPNNEPHDFPDDMSDDDMLAVMRKTYGAPKDVPAKADSSGYREAIGRFENAKTPEERDALRKEISALDVGRPYKGLSTTRQIDDFEKSKKAIESNQGLVGGWNVRRMGKGLTLSWGDELAAAVKTLGDASEQADKPGRDFEWRQRFKENQAVQEALNLKMEDETKGAGGMAAEFAGGLLLPLGFVAKGKQAAQAATSGWSGFREGVKNFVTNKEQVKAAAKTGAVIGGINAAGDNAGGLEDRAVAAGYGASAGTVLGPVLGAGFSGAVGGYLGRNAGKVAEAEARGVNARVARDTYGGEFGPIISDSTVVSSAAPRIAQSIFGGPVRKAAGQETDKLLAQARATMERESGGMSPASAGEDIQSTLQGALRSNSHSLEGKTADELRAIRGVRAEEFTPPAPTNPTEALFPQKVPPPKWSAPASEFVPPPPKDVPVKVDYDQFPWQKETVPEIRPQPKFQPREFFDESADDARVALRARAAEESSSWNMLIEKQQELQSRIFRAEETASVANRQADARYGGNVFTGGAAALRAERDLLKLQREMNVLREKIKSSAQMRAKLDKNIQERGDVLYREHVDAETQRAIALAQDEMKIAKMLQAQRHAENYAKGQSEADRIAMAKADHSNQQRSAEQAAIHRGLEEANRRKVMFADSPEGVPSYPSQRSAGYKLVEDITPDFPANPLGRAGESTNTKMSGLLDQIATEVHPQLFSHGYRGEVYNKRGNDLDPHLYRWLRSNMGSDIADQVKSYAQLRGKYRPEAEKEIERLAQQVSKIAEQRGVIESGQASDFAEKAALKHIEKSPRMDAREADAYVEMHKYVKEFNKKPKAQSLGEFVMERGGLRDVGGDVLNIIGGHKGRPGMINKRGVHIDTMGETAFEAGYFSTRPTTSDFLAALSDDLRGRKVFALADANYADDYRTVQEMQRQLAELGITSRHSEKGAHGLLTGKWSKDDAISDRIASLVEKEADLAKQIEKVKISGENQQFGPKELHQLWTRADRLAREIEYSAKLGQARPENAAALQRLKGALKDDIDSMKRSQGSAGIYAADRRKVEDAAMAEFMDGVQKPLAKLFGPKVEPMEGMSRLLKSAQRGDDQTTKAFMRVMSEHGDPMAAASSLMKMATNEAKTLGEFVAGVKSFAPSTRSIMFASKEGREFLKNMDTLVRYGEKLMPYQRALESGVSGYLNGPNALFAMLMHGTQDIKTLGVTAASTYGLSKMLASPAYVKWLSRVPSLANQSLRSPRWQTHMSKLTGLAAGDGENGGQVMAFVFEALNGINPISTAQASFVGENASGLDKKVLQTAKKMESNGVDRDTIWKTTGWFKGGDGKWRIELDDSDSDVTDDYHAALGEFREDGKTRVANLDQMLSHPKLFEAYPKLGKTKVLVGNMPRGLENARGAMSSKYGVMFMNGEEREHQSDTMLHESQHGVDGFAGFDYGEPGKRGGKLLQDEKRYFRMPGEAQAYNVENRRSMTTEERWARPPWETEQQPEGGLLWSRSKNSRTAMAEARKPKQAEQGTAVDAPEIFTSLEAPPTADEARKAIAAGVKHFDVDIRTADPASIAEIKKAGGKITAYHVGGGGGRDWKGLSPDEEVNKFDTPETLGKLTADTKALVAKGADYIHFDNTHRMSGKRLEQVADAIVAGGAGFVAKNNPSKWNLMMRRRPDLKPAYAVIEAAMHDADETQAAADLAHRGIPVYVIGFKKTLKGDGEVDADYAADYQAKNPWAHVILMEDEKAYEGRTAQSLRVKR
jgi:hypothetical protein